MKLNLTIIIPIYNSEATLSRCLDSVLCIQSISLEVILVNDGSTDSSKTICIQYADRDKRIKILNESNSGSATARNMGLVNATGDYVTFVDSDDYIDPDSLIDFYFYTSKNNLDIAYCDYYGGAGISKCTRNCQNFGSSTEVCIRAMMEGKMHGSTCNKLYKNSFLKESKQKFLDGADVWEDLGFNIRLFYKAKNIGYKKDICYYFYDYDNNGTSLTHNIEKKIVRIKGMVSNVDCVAQFLSELGDARFSKELLSWKSRTREIFFRENRLFLEYFVRLYPETNTIFIQKRKSLNPIYRLSSKLLLKGWISQYLIITSIGKNIHRLFYL